MFNNFQVSFVLFWSVLMQSLKVSVSPFVDVHGPPKGENEAAGRWKIGPAPTTTGARLRFNTSIGL